MAMEQRFNTCPARISGGKRLVSSAIEVEAALHPVQSESDPSAAFLGSWPRVRKQRTSRPEQQMSIWELAALGQGDGRAGYANHEAAAADEEAVAMLEAMSAAVGAEAPSAAEAHDELAALEALTAQAALSTPEDEAAELHALAMLESVSAAEPQEMEGLDTDELLSMLHPADAALSLMPPADDALQLPDVEDDLLPPLLPDELAAQMHRLGVVTPTPAPPAAAHAPAHGSLLPPRRSSNGATRTEWTADEDAAIRAGVAAHGPKWRVIAAALPGRSDDAVRNRWSRLRDATGEPAARPPPPPPPTPLPMATGGSGSDDEAAWLLAADEAAPQKVRRGSSDGSLDGGARRVERVSWTAAEDEIILRRVRELGHKWYKIGRELPGRTDHAIRNRYHRLQTMAADPTYHRGQAAAGPPPPHAYPTVPAVPFGGPLAPLVGA